MIRMLIYLALVLLIAAPAAAQPNLDGFEWTPYPQPDGYRIYFDASVTWEFGGILADPVLSFWQTQPAIEAWLVLVDPTAAQLGGFRIGRRLEGGYTGLTEEVLGAPLSVQIDGDFLTVAYDPPLPLDGTPIALVHWTFLNADVGPVGFYLWPAPGDEVPVYLDGQGGVVPASTYNGQYHEYAVPAAILNGGVTPNEPSTWGGVKALFR